MLLALTAIIVIICCTYLGYATAQEIHGVVRNRRRTADTEKAQIIV